MIQTCPLPTVRVFVSRLIRRGGFLWPLLLLGCQRDDTDSSRVQRVFGTTGLGPGEFSYPRALAVSPVDGCIFVIDKTARVQRFSPAGEFEHGWRMPEYKNGKPTGVYIDAQNSVWIADTHYARVICCDRDGKEQFRFGSRGEGPGQFIFPTIVTRDAEGVIYVGEYGGNDRISRFAPADRRYLGSFADKSAGPGWVERPTALVFDENQVLWVADACHHRICRFDKSGQFLGAFGSPGSGPDKLNYPYGLVLEGTKSLVVADRCNNRFVRFSRDGKLVGAWGSAGRAPGQVLQPWSVARAKNGNLICLDSWNNRVQVINW